MEETILICEDSQEGIFTGIYEAYALRIPRKQIRLQIGEAEMPRLFATYQKAEPDAEKADKVANTLKKRFGEEDYRMICMALTAPDTEKAQAVFRTVEWGLSNRFYKSVFEHLSDDSVRRVMKLSRSAWNEYQHLRGFLRFRELEGGLLYTNLCPKNNVLAVLAVHFADRFPMENFIICDEKRDLYAVHPAGKPWFLMKEDAKKTAVREENTGRLTSEEAAYQDLFRRFCRAISIKERNNPNLQRNLLPLRFRPYMVEFAEK